MNQRYVQIYWTVGLKDASNQECTERCKVRNCKNLTKWPKRVKKGDNIQVKL